MVALRTLGQDPTTIQIGEVTFHPLSFADDAGRVFRWNDFLLRGIYRDKCQFFEQLFDEGTIQDLVESHLLIDSERTEFAADGYGMVVKHRLLPFVSYPNEWCPAMLKDAALLIVDLATALAQRGLNLRDAHPWNVLFDWSRPVFVDFTSIATSTDLSSWSAYDEFCRFCYYPLILMSKGQERIARALLPEYQGVLRSELLALIRGALPSRFIVSKLFARGLNSALSITRRNSKQSAVQLLRCARRSIEAVRLPSYEKENRRRLSESISQSSSTDKLNVLITLRKILRKLQPETILDLSRGPLWSTLVPATMGHNVVSADTDTARIAALYETARKKQLPILPLIIDFIKPTSSVGYSSHYSIAATERLRCDLVLAIGLAEKIHYDNYFSFDLIAEGFASFSKRWLVVGWNQRDAGQTNPTSNSNSTSGSVAEFIRALSKHFVDVKVAHSDSQYGLLLLCEKKF